MTALLSPARIGEVEIRNRVVMPPMTTRLADDEGNVTEDSIAYYQARAAGGVGLITVEMAAPEKAGRHRLRELGIYDDRFLPGLRRLVDALHAEGAKASIQLGHGGGHTRVDICGETPIAPSAIPHPVFEVTFETIVPEAMSHDRIERTTQAFVAAAERAQAAGFDCVEVHAAHGYLISQFLCPEENRRSDEYGGALENRARFGLDILRRIKAAVGLSVIFRFSADDLFPTGMPFSEGIQVAQWAAEAGADAIHVSAAHYRSLPSGAMMTPPMRCPEAIFLDYAAQIKAVVDVPVIAVGRLGNPAVAKDAVDSGKTDFVALGRTLVADPQWVDKVRRGLAVRRCLSCNTCIDEMRGGNRIGCLVNPTAGRERAFAGAKPPQGEKICVVGAGPAGLSYAALVADGNAVTVIDRASGPGGSFRYAGKAPLFQEVEASEDSLTAFIADLERACREAGVEFRYGVDAARTPDVLQDFDRVVFATGAAYRYGLGALVPRLLDAGFGRAALMRHLFARPGLRDWFYHRARRATGDALKRLAKPGQKIEVIGDALTAGKGEPAIASAFQAALDVQPQV
jgi:2,4-dienoyl-CoA reductase-like NADH-dependent reductase (Old Yellow Enzyme family)